MDNAESPKSAEPEKRPITFSLRVSRSELDSQNEAVRLRAEAKVIFNDGTTGIGVPVGFFINGWHLTNVNTDEFGVSQLDADVDVERLENGLNELAVRSPGFSPESFQTFSVEKPKQDTRLEFDKIADLVAQATTANAEARRLVERKLDYELAVSLLERLPEWIRDRTLYQTALSLRSQVRELDDAFAQAQKAGRPNDVHYVIERLSELLPHHEGLKHLQRLKPTIHSEARRLIEGQLDYELAVSILEAIPDWSRDDALYQAALSLRDRVRLLDYALTKAQQYGDQEGVRNAVRDLLEVLPHRDDLRHLLTIPSAVNSEARDLIERQHDYEAAASLLEKNPRWVRDCALYQKATTLRDQVRETERWLVEAMRDGSQDEVRDVALELLQLLPHRDDLKQLVESDSTKAAERRVSRAKEFENSIGMRFALIPRGRFLMGTIGIQRRVWMSRQFYLSVFPVTQAEYLQVMKTNPSWFCANGGGSIHAPTDTQRFPVEEVTWQNAQEFCQKLSEHPAETSAGRRYRLPTEAEWEYACRAGTSTSYSFGDSIAAANANFDRQVGRTTAVGSYPPNAFGLYDMHGNVWEWCNDLDGEDHVLRGGSWMSFTTWVRVGSRRIYKLGGRTNDGFGFRVVCESAAGS